MKLNPNMVYKNEGTQTLITSQDMDLLLKVAKAAPVISSKSYYIVPVEQGYDFPNSCDVKEEIYDVPNEKEGEVAFYNSIDAHNENEGEVAFNISNVKNRTKEVEISNGNYNVNSNGNYNVKKSSITFDNSIIEEQQIARNNKEQNTFDHLNVNESENDLDNSNVKESECVYNVKESNNAALVNCTEKEEKPESDDNSLQDLKIFYDIYNAKEEDDIAFDHSYSSHNNNFDSNGIFVMEKGKQSSSASKHDIDFPNASQIDANNRNPLFFRQRKNPSEIKCPICLKVFKKKSRMERHHQIHQKKKKVFPCKICEKSFPRKSALALHEVVHNEFKYSCEYCSAKFSCQSTKVKHEITRHKDGGEKFTHLCSHCGKYFSSKGSLTQHKKTHQEIKDFECDFCQKTFVSHGDLQRHVRVHTQERPYPCKQCGKAFSTTGGLQSHVKSHTGEKPYVCVVCQKSYATASALVAHEITHGKEKAKKEKVKLEGPFLCGACGRIFTRLCDLNRHMNSSTHASDYTEMQKIMAKNDKKDVEEGTSFQNSNVNTNTNAGHTSEKTKKS